MKKKKLENEFKKIKTKIKQFGKQCKHPKNNKFDNIDIYSSFDLKASKEKKMFNTNIKIKYDKIKNDGYYTERLRLYPTKKQKIILDVWCNCYIFMYNEVIKYIKKCRFLHLKCLLNLGKLKKRMANEKMKIIKWSIKKHAKIQSHCLDYAINDALNNHKSKITNFKKGNIKYFTSRYIKLNKHTKIFKLEKSSFAKSGFCVSVLGNKMKCCIKNMNFVSQINTVAIIQKKYNIFYLLLKHKQVTTNKNRNNKVASIDLGIRRYGTIYANDCIIKFGTMQEEIKHKLEQIDNIKSKEINIKNKNRVVRKKYEKIRNRINDFKWKVIDYLTKNFKTVIIGNLSTKDTGESNKLNKMTKRIGNLYSFFDFKQKLQYKCKHTTTNYKEVDEAYTSKCCCSCGEYNEKLGAKKIFVCEHCNLEIDRDVNGATNILLKSIQ